jgi:hypothetical protein
MHTSKRSQARAQSLSPRSYLLPAAAIFGLAAAFLLSPSADASSGLCENGSCGRSSHDLEQATSERHLSNTLATIAGHGRTGRSELSDQEYFSFSGVGAVVCTVNGEQRNATAFLVGAFDIGVTVAHTFVDASGHAAPENCVYTTTDSLGQVRERIPVAYVKTQWEAEAGAFGELAKDFAVIRLAEPSKFAQRTMPLGKFSGFAANVVMVGFSADIDTGTVKIKSRGRVYDRKTNLLSIPNLVGFAHDMDARNIASGAPVIDERSGVIIGIHTQTRSQAGITRNTMIAMTEWLEATLRTEMQIESAAQVN